MAFGNVVHALTWYQFREDRELFNPLEIARAAISGGSRSLQLRDKLRDKGEILPLANQLQSLCKQNDVDLIINDHADLAALVYF